MSRLRVALIGSRGIPARYGGFETLMEELSTRLVEQDFDVTVYCRSHYTPRSLETYRGVRLVVLPTLPTKYLDTPVHTLLSCIHAIGGRYDAALIVNAANALFVPLLRLAGTPVALNVDGIEKRRAKWGLPGRFVYAISERLATRLPNRLVTDAEIIRKHYNSRYGTDSTVIRYGVSPEPVAAGATLSQLGLEPRRYVLYVSRFEPENNPHRVVEAYAETGGDLPLVMVGDAPYASEFIRAFRAKADSRVLFPGAIYGQGYRELLSHALAYIQATEIGGTHPALVEAMGYGNAILVNDTPENREVVGDAGLYFRAAEPLTLTEALEMIRSDEALAATLRSKAAARAAASFRWDEVTALYADLLTGLAS